MSSNLESEDLAGVQLVRMEDIQPARDRSSEDCEQTSTNIERVETFTVAGLNYENECIVDDDDSNIGSNVSIQSEEVSAQCEEDSGEEESSQEDDDSGDNSGSEMIVPEVVEPRKVFIVNTLVPSPTPPKKEPKSESWPTLEILPGGVIRRSECAEKSSVSTVPKDEGNNSDTEPGEAKEPGEKMYACAKCSKSFKYLYCLVKHVRWHEKQQKSQQTDMTKLSLIEKEMVHIKKARFELEKSYKKEKVEVLARIASALSKIENFEDIMK